MKVLFWLSGSFDRRGPSEHLLTDMITVLCEQGHLVHVLQKNTGGPQPPLPAKLVRLGVNTTRIVCSPAPKNNLAGRFASDVQYVLKAGKWLKAHREYDRIFMQSSNVAGIQTRMLRHVQKGVSVIFNVQDIFPENAVYSGKIKKKGLAYTCFSFMQRHAYRYASKVITISEDMKEQLMQIGVDEQKIEMIYNWSYSDAMYASEKMDFCCLRDVMDCRCFNVVYAGNIGVMQNVEVLIRAAALMTGEEDIRFHIIGDGAYRIRLEKLAAALGTVNVKFHDLMPADCAPAIYSAADINVIPLAKNIYRTALPSKTATCLACGKPIIFAMGKAVRFGRDDLKKSGCILIESDDAAALRDAIMVLKHTGQQADTREWFERDFSKTKNSAAYARVIIQG